jgi:hypothetical protein
MHLQLLVFRETSGEMSTIEELEGPILVTLGSERVKRDALADDGDGDGDDDVLSHRMLFLHRLFANVYRLQITNIKSL